MQCLSLQLGEELYFSVGGQHIPFGASPQVNFYVLCCCTLVSYSAKDHFCCLMSVYICPGDMNETMIPYMAFTRY